MAQKISRRTPWFPFYAADFASTVGTWTLDEIGAYMLLLIEQWNNGIVPTDKKRLAILHPDLPQLWDDRLKTKFPGGRNARLEEIRQETGDRVEAASAKGRKAAAARWGSVPDNSPDAMHEDMQEHMPEQSTSMSSDDAAGNAQAIVSTSIPTSKNKPRSKSKNNPLISDAMWKSFCVAYPKRQGPDPNKNARDKAERCLKTGAQWSDIMSGLRAYKDHCEQTGIEPQFIMRKESFLNPTKEFWNAEYQTPENPPGGNGYGSGAPALTREQELIGLAGLLGIVRNQGEETSAYLDRIEHANRARVSRL